MDEQTRIESDLKDYAALEAVRLSPGGQALADDFAEKVITGIRLLTRGYKSLTHAEMIAACANIAARLEVMDALSNATKNKNGASERLKQVLGS